MDREKQTESGTESRATTVAPEEAAESRTASPRATRALGAARCGRRACPRCGRRRILLSAVLMPGAPVGCRTCLGVVRLVLATVRVWRADLARCQAAARARALRAEVAS